MKLQTAVDKLFSHKLFSNKYFLYAVVAASVLTNYMRIVDCRYEVVGFFILVGIIMMNFSKNVAVVLTVCLLLTQIIMAGQAVQEGLDNMTEETTLSQQIKSKKADIESMKAKLEKATNRKETKIAERRKLRQNMKSAEDLLDNVEKKLKNPGLKNRGNIQDEKGRIKKQREQTRNTLETVNKQIEVDTASQTRLSNNIAKVEKELADLEKLRDEKRAARVAKEAKAKADAAAKADADAAKAKVDAAAKAATPAAAAPVINSTSNVKRFEGIPDDLYKWLETNKNTQKQLYEMATQGNGMINYFNNNWNKATSFQEKNKLEQEYNARVKPDLQRFVQVIQNAKANATASVAATAAVATAAARPATAAAARARARARAKAKTPATKAMLRVEKRKKLRNQLSRIGKNNFALLNESDDDSEDDNAFDFMGPSDISGLTQGTTNLMTKQKDLFSFMNSMTPLIENAKKMLSGLDLSKLRA